MTTPNEELIARVEKLDSVLSWDEIHTITDALAATVQQDGMSVEVFVPGDALNEDQWIEAKPYPVEKVHWWSDQLVCEHDGCDAVATHILDFGAGGLIEYCAAHPITRHPQQDAGGDDREAITEALIPHHLVKNSGSGVRCLCGHEYRLGESIHAHRADAVLAALATRRSQQEVPTGETLTAFGAKLPDGRVQEFRFREGAEEHIAWLRKQKSFAGLVAREVHYGPWLPVDDKEEDA